MKDKERRVMVYIGAFVTPALLMAAVFYFIGIYPGGRTTLLTFDMRAQYAPFFSSLRSVISGEESLFFNWNRTLGGNYLGLYAYYLANPLSWLTALVDLRHLPDAIYVLSLLKYGLCGLSMSIFLDGISGRKARPVLILFSSCYALMSYNIIYGICLMWMDGLIFLPLILLGEERLLEGGRGGLFYASLTAMFYCNYYISYMVGIFAALYLVFRVCSEWGEYHGKGCARLFARFGACALLAAGSAMPLLWPALRDLETGKGKLDAAGANDFFQYPFFRVFLKLLPMQYDSITSEDALPSLFCGTFILLMVIVFFFHKKITVREKIGALLLVNLFLCSFWMEPLDRLWHGFQRPHGFPYRYAFGFGAFLIYLAYRGYLLIEGIWDKYKLAVCLAVGYTLLELGMNSVNIMTCITLQCSRLSYTAYRDEVETVLPLLEGLRERDPREYRIEKDFYLTSNDGFLYGYKGLASFCSSFHYDVNAFLKSCGYEQYIISSRGNGATELTDSLLGVKYRLSRTGGQKDYVPVESKRDVVLYQNPYALSLAYLVPEELSLADPGVEGDPFVRQERLLSAFAGEELTVFEEVPFSLEDTETGWVCRFVAPSEEAMYFRLEGQPGGETRVWNAMTSFWTRECPVRVSVNGKMLRNYDVDDTNCILYLGSFRKGEKVEVGILLQRELSYLLESVSVCELDSASMQNGLERLRAGELQTVGGKGVLEGTVTAGEGQVLFTTIPYDPGLRVEVDGERVRPEAFEETFLMIPMSAGEHRVVVSYFPPGLLTGFVTGIFAVALAVGWLRFRVNRETP